MSDTATIQEQMPPALAEKLENIGTITKRGFDVVARLKNRGLRKASITLFLDETKGPELGWAYDINDGFGNVTGRARGGIIGDLEVAEVARVETIRQWDELATSRVAGAATGLFTDADLTEAEAVHQADLGRADVLIAELTEKRDALIAELSSTALFIKLQAVPPVIQKNARRLAKQTLGITEKGVPEDLTEEMNIAQTAHLMTMVFQSMTDNSTGETNTELTYDDAIALMEYLPAGQFARLDMLIGEIQFADAISRSIEGQEDFS